MNSKPLDFTRFRRTKHAGHAGIHSRAIENVGCAKSDALLHRRLCENGSFWRRRIDHLQVFETGAQALPDVACLLFAAAEIQVSMRQSVQNQIPQYRPSVSLVVAETVHGFYSRSFRSALAKRPCLVKRIDATAGDGINAAREAQNEPPVDLEAGVTPEKGGDFKDFVEFEAGAKCILGSVARCCVAGKPRAHSPRSNEASCLTL